MKTIQSDLLFKENIPQELVVSSKIYQIPEKEFDFQWQSCNPAKFEQSLYYKFGEKSLKNNIKYDKITIKPCESLPKLTNIKRKTALSFEIEDVKILYILNLIREILNRPNLVLSYLKDLDLALEKELQKQEIALEYNYPQFLVTGRGFFIAGPCEQNYIPYNKNKILNKLLLEREKEHGINLNGVSIFNGAIDSKDADLFVKDGNIFSENEQKANFIEHGKYSHRLAFEIIRQAAKEDDILQSISQKNLLEILTGVDAGYPIIVEDYILNDENSAWTKTIDSVETTIAPTLYMSRPYLVKKYLLDYKNYSYNCGSPFTLKSLLTCFADQIEDKEMRLNSLARYLRDSHYKQMFQIANRARKLCKDKILAVPDDYVITYCIISSNTDDKTEGQQNLPISFFNKKSDDAQKYRKFDAEKFPNSEIMLKNDSPEKAFKRFDSWQSYKDHKDNQQYLP